MEFNIPLLVLIITCLHGVSQHWTAYIEAKQDEIALRKLHKDADSILLRGVRGDQREELLRAAAKSAFALVFAISMTYSGSLLLQMDWRAIAAFSLQFLALGFLSASTYYKRLDRKQSIQDALLLQAAEDHIERSKHQEVVDALDAPR